MKDYIKYKNLAIEIDREIVTEICSKNECPDCNYSILNNDNESFNCTVVFALKYLEEKGKIITIQPLKFPSWEDVEKESSFWKGFKWKNYLICASFDVDSDCVQLETSYSDKISSYTVRVNSYDKQGYEKACQWLTNKRIELIKELAEGMA